jgi:hypothetical protein
VLIIDEISQDFVQQKQYFCTAATPRQLKRSATTSDCRLIGLRFQPIMPPAKPDSRFPLQL